MTTYVWSPQIHKQGVPLRLIFSMTNAPQHELAKWLAELSKLVVEKFGGHTVEDTFEFCSLLDKYSALCDSMQSHICSFNTVSLFTNTPLRETFKVCLDTLHHDDDDVAPPTIPEKVLEKLLIRATADVEF